jgi:hypothetical protein
MVLQGRWTLFFRALECYTGKSIFDALIHIGVRNNKSWREHIFDHCVFSVQFSTLHYTLIATIRQLPGSTMVSGERLSSTKLGSLQHSIDTSRRCLIATITLIIETGATITIFILHIYYARLGDGSRKVRRKALRKQLPNCFVVMYFALAKSVLWCCILHLPNPSPQNISGFDYISLSTCLRLTIKRRRCIVSVALVEPSTQQLIE